MRKQFDPELFADNDSRARAAVMHVLNEDGVYACPNYTDKYGPDLLVYVGYTPKWYVECEVKRVWKAGQKFPWETVQVPERKLKFTEFRTKHCEFWILREDLKSAIIISEEVLRASPIVEVPNKLVATGERFIQVPVSECNIREWEYASLQDY